MKLEDEGIGPRDGAFIAGGDLKFRDGMTFNTQTKPHIERRSDGLYAVGDGMLIPVDSIEEGKEWLEHFSKKT